MLSAVLACKIEELFVKSSVGTLESCEVIKRFAALEPFVAVRYHEFTC